MVTTRIARRFLFSTKSHSIVNAVAAVSVVAIAVPTAAMIVVLSLHNGLQQHIRQLYSAFDAPLKISAQYGQMFDVDSAQMLQLKSLGEVSTTLDCNVLAQWGDEQVVAVVRGVDSNFSRVIPIKGQVRRGEWRTVEGELPRAVVGAGVAYNLGMSLGVSDRIHIYTTLPTPPQLAILGVPLMMESDLTPSGVFSLDEQTDSRYIFTDLRWVQDISGNYDRFSSIEVAPKGDIDKAAERIGAILGDDIVVQNREQQRSTIYTVVGAEKRLVYLLLSMVAAIAALSLAGCSLMMIAEKRYATSTLRAMGLSAVQSRRIFVRLSMAIVMIGIASGLTLGVGLCLIQLYFEPLKMAGDSFLLTGYPIHIQASDLLLTATSVGVIGYLIILSTVRIAK